MNFLAIFSHVNAAAGYICFDSHDIYRFHFGQAGLFNEWMRSLFTQDWSLEVWHLKKVGISRSKPHSDTELISGSAMTGSPFTSCPNQKSTHCANNVRFILAPLCQKSNKNCVVWKRHCRCRLRRYIAQDSRVYCALIQLVSCFVGCRDNISMLGLIFRGDVLNNMSPTILSWQQALTRCSPLKCLWKTGSDSKSSTALTTEHRDTALISRSGGWVTSLDIASESYFIASLFIREYWNENKLTVILYL